MRQQCQKLEKNYWSDLQVTAERYGHFGFFIPSTTNFTKYGITQWISQLHGSFEIHSVRQNPVHYMGLVGIVDTTVYKTDQFSQVSSMADCPNF